VIPLFIPSPPQNVWHLGPVPIRAYALCVLAGIVVAWLVARRRWRRLGGDVEKLENLLLVTVVCGVVGARLYYVLIEWGRFFGPGGVWYHIFFVWQGGLGIWGGLSVGALTVGLMARHYRFRLAVLLDCIAPGLPLAQALGRFGNYFNQELYGRPTTLPWGLEIDPAHRVAGYVGQATFHPTFLYESAWNVVLAAVLLLVVERRLAWGRGKLFATYVVGYALGRFTVESFRIDPVKVFGPLRINAWVTLVLGLCGLGLLLWLVKRRPGPNRPGDAAALEPRSVPPTRAADQSGAASDGVVTPAAVGPVGIGADHDGRGGASPSRHPPSASPTSPDEPPESQESGCGDGDSGAAVDGGGDTDGADDDGSGD